MRSTQRHWEALCKSMYIFAAQKPTNFQPTNVPQADAFCEAYLNVLDWLLQVSYPQQLPSTNTTSLL